LAPPIVAKQRTIIDAAVEAGVSRFIPSEFGFDLTTPFNSRQPAYKMKVAIEHHLKEVVSSNPSFSYTLISNGIHFLTLVDIFRIICRIHP
jgi:NmrA-like family